jgi:hypothetical protein
MAFSKSMQAGHWKSPNISSCTLALGFQNVGLSIFFWMKVLLVSSLNISLSLVQDNKKKLKESNIKIFLIILILVVFKFWLIIRILNQK